MMEKINEKCSQIKTKLDIVSNRSSLIPRNWVIIGTLSHVIKKDTISNQHMKCSYREYYTLLNDEKNNYLKKFLINLIKIFPKIYLSSHKSAHVNAIKNSKNDWDNNHNSRYDKNRRQQQNESEVRPSWCRRWKWQL